MAVACSGGTSPTPRASAPSSGPTVTPSAPTATGPAPSPLHLEVWFERVGKLFETTRSIAPTTAVGTSSMHELIAGPSSAEQGAGVESEVPADTGLIGLSVADGTATVTLSDAYALGNGSERSQRMRTAPVVYTLTQFPAVHGV